MGEATSERKCVHSGVPQGSVLGPLLFVLFIDDLPSYLSGVARLFADDLKLIYNVSNINVINEDLKMLEEWEQMWLLTFNPSKCKVMHISYNSNPENSYILHDTALKETCSKRDLGIIINNTLN
ncbi:MAG: hypothetical protein HRT95_20310 [Moritella sp.]|nr:hypothetical protein [Moritella sp.]